MSDLFQKQDHPKQVLKSLLIALNFTSPLEIRYLQSIVSGFVYNKHFYIHNLIMRGWFKKQGNLLFLSSKGQQLLQSYTFTMLLNRKETVRLISHEVLLVRSLFLCLLHLNLNDIKQIKKQKFNQDTSYIPDLTIITHTATLLVEIDTGSEPISTLEAKIKGFQNSSQTGTLLYFTSSDKTYFHFSDNSDVQFIYLHSPNLSSDIQQLRVISKGQVAAESLSNTANSHVNPDESSSFSASSSQKTIYKVADNVFISDPLLVEADNTATLSDTSQNLDQMRDEVSRLLAEDL